MKKNQTSHNNQTINVHKAPITVPFLHPKNGKSKFKGKMVCVPVVTESTGK